MAGTLEGFGPTCKWNQLFILPLYRYSNERAISSPAILDGFKESHLWHHSLIAPTSDLSIDDCQHRRPFALLSTSWYQNGDTLVQFVLRCQSRPGVAAYLLTCSVPCLPCVLHYGTLQNDEGLNVIGEGAEPAFPLCGPSP